MTIDEARSLSRRHYLFPEEGSRMGRNGRLEQIGYRELKMGTVGGRFLPGEPPEFFGNLTVSEIVAGWPLKSFRRVALITEDAETYFDQYISFSPRPPVRVLSEDADGFLIPLRPIWSGFALSSLFYAMLLLVALLAPRLIREKLRIRRGRCPRCAYPIGVSDRCSECGNSIPQTARRVQRKTTAATE